MAAAFSSAWRTACWSEEIGEPFWCFWAGEECPDLRCTTSEAGQPTNDGCEWGESSREHDVVTMRLLGCAGI